MGIIKQGIDRLKKFFKPKQQQFTATVPANAAARRKAKPALRYLWVSKAIPEDVGTALMLGMPNLIRLIMRRAKGQGSTYNVGSNALKRTADSLRGSNKERRRLRTRMKNRRDELMAAA